MSLNKLTLYLLGIVMFTNVASAKLLLLYTCQIGEKPGVPQYKLEIADSTFKIVFHSLLHKEKKQEQSGVLSSSEVKQLKQIVQKLPEKLKVQSSSIAGFFKLTVIDAGFNKTLEGNSEAKQESLEGLIQWINNLHQNHQNLKSIAPIFPGDIN